MPRLFSLGHYPPPNYSIPQYTRAYKKFYPKLTGYKMGNFTQNIHGKKWVKKGDEVNIQTL
jgi:hypothetical protein